MQTTSKLVSAFECILNNKVGVLKESNRQEAYKILVEEYFCEFLDYLEEKNVIDNNTKLFLSMEMYLYEIDSMTGEYLNYYEEDFDKRNKLIEKVFNENIDEYAEKYNNENS